MSNQFFRLISLFSLVVSTVVMAEQSCESELIQASTPVERFKIEEHVVTDTKTGLMWRRCFVGMSGELCSEGDASLLNWASALQYIERENNDKGFVGFNDWRMPNIRELQTIAELQCVEPSLSPVLFPSAPSGRTWSSSPYKFYVHYSWFVDFKFFEVTYQERYNPYFVILVRNIGA